MSYIEKIVDSPIIQLVVIIISILAFIITILSYVKIKKVKEGQILYQNHLDLDNLINTLEITKNFISLKSANEIDELRNQQEIIGNINKQITNIETVNRVLFQKNKLGLKSNVIFHASGYYNDEFFSSVILKANKKIIIYGKRNTRVFKQENILKIFELAKKSCYIELMFFSPNISNDLLEEIRKSVPYPPKTIDEMRKTQIEYKKEFLEQKEKQKCDNIKYYESYDFPLFQFVLVDNKLYFGIVNYNKEDEKNTVYDDRPYLEFDVLDEFARKILKKYSILLEKCECY